MGIFNDPGIEYIDVMYDMKLSDEEKANQMRQKIREIEQEGGRIVSAEPIEKIYVQYLGRRVGVEREK